MRFFQRLGSLLVAVIARSWRELQALPPPRVRRLAQVIERAERAP